MESAKRTGTDIPSNLMDELRQAAERAAQGVRDPQAMRQACERMDRISEQTRKRHGVLDIGAPAIRALRDVE